MLGVSLDNGFASLNHMSWNAYHEGKDLISQVAYYFEIHGYYPDLVQIDKAYSTRENRKWLKERNHIEAKFGQGKNGYNLNKIRTKLKSTSETWVSCIFFVMNLINYQKKSSFGSFFIQLWSNLLHSLNAIDKQKKQLHIFN